MKPKSDFKSQVVNRPEYLSIARLVSRQACGQAEHIGLVC